MKFHRLWLTFILFFSSVGLAQEYSRLGLSPHRDAFMSGAQAEAFAQGARIFTTARGPSKFKKPLSELDLSTVAEAPSLEFIQNEFRFLRDERFLTYQDKNFLRRLTWLFPDDGCYARAELMAKLLEKKNSFSPVKIFAFGDLSVYSSNIPGGIVNWWYHVAIAFKFQNTLYVIDPSIEPKHPLTVEEWVKAMSVTSYNVQVSLCSAKTFDPNADCIAPHEITQEKAIREITPFLPQEWNRLLRLQRSPNSELGESPPWKD